MNKPAPVPAQEDPQLQLFVAAFTDISIRDAQETMTVPCLSLTKTPRFEPLTYQTGDMELIVSGGKPYGIANIWDWDIMLWLLSQVRQGIDEGIEVSRKIRFHPYAYMRATGKETGGHEYKSFKDSVLRLKNTNIYYMNTRVKRRRGKNIAGFNWIEYCSIPVELDDESENAKVKKKDKLDPRDPYVTVQLPEWLFEAVQNPSLVLTLSQDYFDLTGGLERWLYRFIRKQAGSGSWEWKLKTLYERSGSVREYKYFVRDFRTYILGKDKENPSNSRLLLDYELILKENKEGEDVLRAQYIHRHKKDTGPQTLILPQRDVVFLHLSTTTYEEAKEILLGTGLDVYQLEAQWRESSKAYAIDIKNANHAFLGWCRAVAKRQ